MSKCNTFARRIGTCHPGHPDVRPGRVWPSPKTGGHLVKILGASGSALTCPISGRQTETQAAEIRQLPFLAVTALIKKPHAARFQAPSTDLRDLLIASLSLKDTAERRLYLPLIRTASLRSRSDRDAAFSSPASPHALPAPSTVGSASPSHGEPGGLPASGQGGGVRQPQHRYGQHTSSLHCAPGIVPRASNTVSPLMH